MGYLHHSRIPAVALRSAGRTATMASAMQRPEKPVCSSVVVKAAVNYRAPARYDEELSGRSRLQLVKQTHAL